MDAPLSKIDFIGIGVQKAATSWLFTSLQEHPDIRAAVGPNNKELNFFNHNYEKGYPRYHHRFEFGPWKTGEYSVLYFHDKNVPERIYRYNPHVKLILSLRNPIGRAFSQHRHEVRRNRLPRGLYDFWKALEQNPTYIEQGKYASHLEHYLRFFDLGQIHVVLFEDVISRPEVVIQNLFRFLGVDSSFRTSLLGQKTNVAHTYRSRFLHNLFRTTSNSVRKFFGDLPIKLVKATNLPTLIRRFNEIEFDGRIVPSLSEDERARLQEVFAEENERLGILIGRDLSFWNR